jgi:nicotinate-nucleotide adenylyltransferase
LKIGLFFGSFNPIHVGHLIIANFMATQTDLDQVWLVVSPHNPLKPKKTLARDRDRLNMVQNAVENNTRLKVTDIEFKMPQPSYTINTLSVLSDKFPQHSFTLIMGGDNLAGLHKWKNFEIILAQYRIYVYARMSDVECRASEDSLTSDIQHPTSDIQNHPNVKIFNAPLMDISATYIRNCVQKNVSIEYLVPETVLKYIEEAGLYK